MPVPLSTVCSESVSVFYTGVASNPTLLIPLFIAALWGKTWHRLHWEAVAPRGCVASPPAVVQAAWNCAFLCSLQSLRVPNLKHLVGICWNILKRRCWNIEILTHLTAKNPLLVAGGINQVILSDTRFYTAANGFTCNWKSQLQQIHYTKIN